MSPLSVAVVKGTMNLAGVGVLVSTVEGFWDAKFLLELTVVFVSLISVAAVMRSRVDGLEKNVASLTKWQKDHDNEVHEYKDKHAELHRTSSESLAVLKQIMENNNRRLETLEAERWRIAMAGKG